MTKKNEANNIFFSLRKQIGMICTLISLNLLNQLTFLNPFLFDVLTLIFIFYHIYWSSGHKSLQPAHTNNKTLKQRNSIFCKWFAREKKRNLNLNGTCTEIRGNYAVDRLFISAKQISDDQGNNGSVIFEGIYQGRMVAVKRLSKALNKVALKEVRNLTASDHHPNIVRLHGVKEDKNHVYLVLERCICSLSELVSLPWNDTTHNLSLWKSNGYPSPLLLQLMRDMVCGLVRLHELGIIHQDINPQNVMIAKGKNICAKLCNIGISNGSECYDQKLHKRRRWAADIFSLGRVFYFCLTRGAHQLEYDIHNGGSRMSLHLVAHIPEAVDLLSCLLDPKPEMRPKAYQVLRHPLFWDSEMRVSFLRDVSDGLESLRKGSKVLITLEKAAQQVFGTAWDTSMELELVKDIRRRRRYRYTSIQHLLRAVRNKLNHFHHSPRKIQELIGPVPENFDDYFSRRYPRLVIEVYKVIIKHCRTDKLFQKYFGCDYVALM